MSTQNKALITHVPSEEELKSTNNSLHALEDYTLTPGAFKALANGATKSVIELNREFPVEGPVVPYIPVFEDMGPTQPNDLVDDDLNAPARPMNEVREIVKQLEDEA